MSIQQEKGHIFHFKTDLNILKNRYALSTILRYTVGYTFHRLCNVYLFVDNPIYVSGSPYECNTSVM